MRSTIDVNNESYKVDDIIDIKKCCDIVHGNNFEEINNKSKEHTFEFDKYMFVLYYSNNDVILLFNKYI